MQTAVGTHPEKKADLVRASAGIADMIRAGKLDLARKLMDGVDAILLRVDPRANPLQTEFDRRFQALDKRVQEALQKREGDVSEIRTVSGFASEKAEKRDYAAALNALDRLEKLLDQSAETGNIETGAPYEGLVKYRSALYEFAKAKDQVAKQIAALKKAIPATLPDEVEIADEVADTLLEWNNELAALVDEAIDMAEDEESPIAEEIPTRLRQYLDDLGSEDLIKHVETNPFGVSVTIKATLGDALRKIQKSMPVHTATA
jgi:hypothetical protein